MTREGFYFMIALGVTRYALRFRRCAWIVIAFLFLFQFLLDTGKSSEISKRWFFNLALDRFHSLAGLFGFGFCFLTCNIFLFGLSLFPDACMRQNNALFIAVEFDHHEFFCFICHHLFAVFFGKMTVR